MNKVIEFIGVGFAYREDKNVFQGLNLSIYENEKVAIIGPNGAGKSTFITLLNGVNKGVGIIKIDGIEITEKNGREIKSKVGIVFQNPDDQLFCPTVYDDIAFGPLNMGCNEGEIKQKVESALDSVGLKGYENEHINELSYGERKLISLATVISMDPGIIAFDEPSSNLDPLHRRKMIDWIVEKKSKTIVITTHDLDMVLDTCDRVILLEKGKVVADGKPEVLLKDETHLKEHSLELPLSLQR